MYCYTTEKMNYVPPKVPYGGGFGYEKFTLNYLYEEYRFHNNIWTASNIMYDLCRYLYVKFIFYRHPDTDFVVAYNNMPPFDINKFTFPSRHPHLMLLERHKKIILSKSSVTNGKYKVRMLVKPPKQMITKWFFTQEFCQYTLLLLAGSALNLRYSHLSASNENLLVNISSLNWNFYSHTNWMAAHTGGQGYIPITGLTRQLKYYVYEKGNPNPVVKTMSPKAYEAATALSYEFGWFNPSFLKSVKLEGPTSPLALNNIIYGRYNPTKDSGEGNKIYIISTVADHWGPPEHDKMILIEGLPLWLGIFGFLSYLKTVKPGNQLQSSLVVLVSDAIYTQNQIGGGKYWAPIDTTYIEGKKPFNQAILDSEKSQWCPNYKWQLQTLNAIVESGPFVPQYNEEKYSTWELKYTYDFCFKWGGPEQPQKEVKNPKELKIYDVPDKLLGTIQITNPAKQATETIIHPWQIRRGLIKEAALKRMCDHLQTDTEFQCSSEEDVPKKRQRLGAALSHPQEEEEKIQNCLQELSEENIFQETDQTLENLIKQQQKQQQELKYHILQLLFDLKNKQRQLQLHTGLIE